MDVTFHNRIEEYYQRFIDLQEKLRKSEEERLKLEIKFNEIVHRSREEEQAHYRKLRSQYKRFLDEDRKRQYRNEKILRALERIESRVNSLMSKTERFKILRRQYQGYLDRASQTQGTVDMKLKYSAPKLGDISKPTYDEVERSISLTNADGDKMAFLNKYLDNLNSNNCVPVREPIPSYKNEMNTLDELSRKLSSNFDSLKANSIAEDIMKSIYNRHYKKDPFQDQQSQARQSKLRYGQSDQDDGYENNIVDKKCDYKEKYAGGDTDENRYNVLKHIVGNKDLQASNGVNPEFLIESGNHITEENNTNSKAMQFINEPVMEITRQCTEKLKSFQNNDVKTSENALNNSSPSNENSLDQNSVISQQEGLGVNNFDKKGQLSLSKIKKTVDERSDAYPDLPINQHNEIQDEKGSETVELLPTTLKEKHSFPEIHSVSENNQDENKLLIEQIEESYNIGENQTESKNSVDGGLTNINSQDINTAVNYVNSNDSNDENKLVNQNRDIYDRSEDVNGQPEQSDLQYVNQQSAVPQTDLEYNEYENVVSHFGEEEQHSQTHLENVEGSYHGHQSQFDEKGQPIYQNYDENSQQGFQQGYGDPNQLLTQEEYDENGQLIAKEQYDEQGQPVHLLYDQNGYPIHQQYDENGQLISQQQYDENGQPIYQQEYDENGQPILYQQYDENGQPITQQYDENGQPITQQYDENGQPILHEQFDSNGQLVFQQQQHYDENGQPILYQQYDEQGQPVLQYDENDQSGTTLQFGESSHSLLQQQNVEHHQPVLEYDQDGQPIIHGQFDENGQVIQYEEHDIPEYTQPIDPSPHQLGSSAEIIQDGSVQDSPVCEAYSDVQGVKISPEDSNVPQNLAPSIKSADDANSSSVQVEQNQENFGETIKKSNNVLDLLDTDTESIKQNTSKITNDSDFDFSNG